MSVYHLAQKVTEEQSFPQGGRSTALGGTEADCNGTEPSRPSLLLLCSGHALMEATSLLPP